MKHELNPLPDLKKILSDGKPVQILNYPKKNYEKQNDFSIHGFMLYRTPNLSSISDFITPLEIFFIRNHMAPPLVKLDKWKLELTGCFKNEVKLSLEQIKEYENVTKVQMIECTGNQQAEYSRWRNIKNLSRWINLTSFNQIIKMLDPRKFKWWISFLSRSGMRGGNMISNGVFTGVRLFDVLKDFPLTENAKEIVFEGIDIGADTAIQQMKNESHNYARSWNLEELKKYEPLLCFEMNGQPLKFEHGSPLRVIIPGIYSHEQVKWLGRVIALSEKHQGYFQNEYYGYKIDGETVPVHEMRVKSLIIKALKKNQTVTVFGIAWRGLSPINRIEVSTDGLKSWEPAELLCDAIDNSWLFFRYTLPQGLNGTIKIASRAYCKNGDCQPLQPGKYSSSYGNNSVFSAVIKI